VQASSLPTLLLRILLACVLLTTACSRGPGEAELRDELLRRLDTRFEEGLFAIRDFRRSG
jgi:hypothetical protein